MISDLKIMNMKKLIFSLLFGLCFYLAPAQKIGDKKVQEASFDGIYYGEDTYFNFIILKSNQPLAFSANDWTDYNTMITFENLYDSNGSMGEKFIITMIYQEVPVSENQYSNNKNAGSDDRWLVLTISKAK